jgi:WD40 repeat protein
VNVPRNHIVTGAYDGSLRIVELPWIPKEKDGDGVDDASIDHEYVNVVQRAAHELFVKCIEPLEIEHERADDGVNEVLKGFRCVSGSKDKTIKIWSWNPQSNFVCDTVLVGHTLGVECLAASPNRDRVCIIVPDMHAPFLSMGSQHSRFSFCRCCI